MITIKVIPICQRAFQGKLLVWSLHKSMGTLNFNFQLRRNSGYCMRTMACEGALMQDPHITLGVAPGAAKYEIKKAYRHLALEYHPDVCKGNHCTTNFQQINFAYETLLNMATPQGGECEDDSFDNMEGFMGVGDDSWEDWEEWMSWEGAGTLDYYDHINNAIF
jgi:hypothetical protein